MPNIQHWIILSPPNEYAFERVTQQRGKIVDWDAGLCLLSNEQLSKMKPRDRVIFVATGPNRNLWVCIFYQQISKEL